MNTIFSKRKKVQNLEFLTNILNAMDNDIVVMRGDHCEIVFMNSAARARVYTGTDGEDEGVTSYLDCFPQLCATVSSAGPEGDPPHYFDTFDHNGVAFSVNLNIVEWVDGSPANILFLRDISEEREVQKKLYDLAYMDYLTGVPNRQKLREDFDRVKEPIQLGRHWGVVAIFDLDNFKSINDTYGHNTGDILLKRLTEHLSSPDHFKGHLYRLGGDEFVVFYSDEANRFEDLEKARLHYTQMLEGAFREYTMPNIEISCTISMGVAFFPEHGYTFSDLLRKADIALYKAKAAGRDNMVIFEDQYDSAKKFKDLYINIQPVLTRREDTYGYELIDSGNKDGEVMNLTEFDRTMDALGLGDLENTSRYFIAYSPMLLNKSIRKNLPKDKFVVVVHLTGPCTTQQMEKLAELKGYGYQLALDGLNEANGTPELMELVKFCKFEPGMMDLPQQKRMIERHADKWFIATDVNTLADFETAQLQGFRLYQGFFFNQPPEVKKTKDISPLKSNYDQLLRLTSTDDYVNFQQISTVIASDVALSYKLLRLLNSAAVGLRNPLSSIEMAVAFLGEENLKKWIAMLALRGVAADKPLELVRLSLIRAQFGELLAPHFSPKRNVKHVFLTGMFSLLHIALEQSQEELLNDMPVADDIRNSLLTDSGPYSDMIPFFSAYEYANWDEVSRFAQEHSLSDRLINDCYIQAVKWYNSLSDEGEAVAVNLP